MIRQRIIETNEGIQGELTVEIFNRFARNMRDKGWDNSQSILNAGITQGAALEIGPGPGYVGLEWLKYTAGTTLTGCEISRDMIRQAEINAAGYGLQGRVCYVQGNAMDMPFEAGRFDAVFSNGSLHEWEDPVKVFDEIARVLKPGGQYCITDMRRDVSPVVSRMIYHMTKPREIRPGFLTSLNASYTADEIRSVLERSSLNAAIVRSEFFGLCISGQKPE